MPDTSAMFDFDISYSTPNDITFYNGTFTDANPDAFGNPEHPSGFGVTGVSSTDTSATLSNPDGDGLTLTLTSSLSGLPIVTGTYFYSGPIGEEAIGTFTASVGLVPLPASAPMFGAALLALGAAGYGLKRKAAAA